MRARRDAESLQTPLFIVQLADASTPVMPAHMAAKLMNNANPKNTDGMHGILPVHLGLHVRLVEALSINDGLVKDAEGEIGEIVVNPLDQDLVDTRASGSRLMI